MDHLERAGIVADAAARAWRDKPGDVLTVPVGDRRMVVYREPGLIYNRAGDAVGVDAWIRLYEADGREVRVDPHRRIIGPPTVHHELGEDPLAAWLQVVGDSVQGTPNPRGWRTRGTVDTFFSGTADGRCEGNSATYSIAREGTGTINVTTTDTSRFVGQFFSSTYSCYELFFSWDTSSIADTNIVSAVTLDLWLVTDSSTSGFTLEAREHDWGASLTSADYVAGSALSGKTLMASLGTSGIGSTGAYKTFTSQAAFLSATNLKTGTVYVMVSSSEHRLGNAPSGTDGVTFSMADNAGTTQDPKLTVTHAAPAGKPFSTSKPLRVWKVRRH